MELSDIFLIILLASASILCLALVFYLNRITRSVARIEAEVNELTGQIKPLVVSAAELSSKLNLIAENLNNEIEDARGVVSDVRGGVNKILTLEEKLRRGIEGPITELLKNIAAVFNGVNTFWNAYRK